MLTDFGIAKIIDEELTVDLTGTSAAVGTPEYMAPEQVTSKTVDQRADIYALGVVYYEMVTGRKPFQADTPMAVLFKHATEPLPRPNMFVSDLPNKVEKVLIKALAKNRDERYQTMAEMSNALDELVESKRQKEVPASKATPKPTSVPPILTEETVSTIDQAEGTLATIDQVEETLDTIDQPVETRATYEQGATLTPEIKAENGKSKKSWGWVLIGISALISGISMGIGSYVQTQNMQATATAQAYIVQSTATKYAYQMQATATKQAEQTRKTATAQARLAQLTATAETRKRNLTATAQTCANLINISIKDTWDTFICDPFVDNKSDWEIGNFTYDLYTGVRSITNGKLTWKVTRSEGFVHWIWPNFSTITTTDFYLSVEARRVSGPEISACYGLWFRGDGSDFYIFEVCDDQTYQVVLSNEAGWETLIGFNKSSAIKPNQSNKLSIIAEGSSFEFYINDQLVDSLTNSHWARGYVGIMIEMGDGDTTTYEFDNFVVVKP